VPNLSAWLGDVDALVCMGGYNTLAEALARGTPTVCVPRVAPRREQLIRARAFSSRGLLRIVELDALSPERLRAEVAAALASPPGDVASRVREALDLGGARRAAAHLLELAEAAAPVAA
jgi:predicted glycosyltransferase